MFSPLTSLTTNDLALRRRLESAPGADAASRTAEPHACVEIVKAALRAKPTPGQSCRWLPPRHDLVHRESSGRTTSRQAGARRRRLRPHSVGCQWRRKAVSKRLGTTSPNRPVDVSTRLNKPARHSTASIRPRRPDEDRDDDSPVAGSGRDTGGCAACRQEHGAAVWRKRIRTNNSTVAMFSQTVSALHGGRPRIGPIAGNCRSPAPSPRFSSGLLHATSRRWRLGRLLCALLTAPAG